MKIECLIVGQLQTNCYLVYDENSLEGVIIDPGDAGDFIVEKVHRLGLKPKLIVATHGHFDHILAALEVKLAFNIPFSLHQKDLFLLKRTKSTAEYFTGVKADPAAKVDQFLKESDRISFGKEKLQIIETPGHTPGGVSLYSKGVIFSGDTLFKQGVGRTDLSYASADDLGKSLKKIFKLPLETIVYPGHGKQTTIKAERKLGFKIVKF